MLCLHEWSDLNTLWVPTWFCTLSLVYFLHYKIAIALCFIAVYTMIICCNQICMTRNRNYRILLTFYIWLNIGSSVIECLTRDWRAAGLSLNSVTALCPWHINPSLVLVQPRKTHPDVTERLGCKESNVTKQNLV